MQQRGDAQRQVRVRTGWAALRAGVCGAEKVVRSVGVARQERQ